MRRVLISAVVLGSSLGAWATTCRVFFVGLSFIDEIDRPQRGDLAAVGHSRLPGSMPNPVHHYLVRYLDGWPRGGLQAGVNPVPPYQTAVERAVLRLVGQPVPGTNAPDAVVSVFVSPDQTKAALFTERRQVVIQGIGAREEEAPSRIGAALVPVGTSPGGVMAMSNDLIVLAERLRPKGQQRSDDYLTVRRLSDPTEVIHRELGAGLVNSILISPDESTVLFSYSNWIKRVDFKAKKNLTYFPLGHGQRSALTRAMFLTDRRTVLAPLDLSAPDQLEFVLLDFENGRESAPIAIPLKAGLPPHSIVALKPTVRIDVVRVLALPRRHSTGGLGVWVTADLRRPTWRPMVTDYEEDR